MTIPTEIIDQILGNAKTEEDLFGKEGLLKQLTKQLMERILAAELTHHLGYEKHCKQTIPDNARNGKRSKKVKTGNGEVQIDVPRDRNSDFEPAIIPKRQRRLAGMDDKILALYAKGMTVRDIQSFLEELYNTEISTDLISNVTDSILDELNDWRNRPLDKLYPIVYIDGFVAKCRLDGRVCNRTSYIVYGITLDGHKEVLGLYLGENESSKYWLTVLTNLKNRGLEDIFLICADGLKGLPESVESAFPKTIFQTCIVHMVRGSLNYVPYKEKKAVAEDLKKIYQADTLELAESALDDFELTWGDKYSAIVKSWRNNWPKIIPFFDFPKDIRKIIYTTNILESLNRTLRKAVKNRGQFPTEDSLMKVLFLAIRGISKKWTIPIKDWTGALNQFAIVFEDRFPKELIAS